jgi:hypothetical protein
MHYSEGREWTDGMGTDYVVDLDLGHPLKDLRGASLTFSLSCKPFLHNNFFNEYNTNICLEVYIVCEMLPTSISLIGNGVN